MHSACFRERWKKVHIMMYGVGVFAVSGRVLRCVLLMMMLVKLIVVCGYFLVSSL